MIAKSLDVLSTFHSFQFDLVDDRARKNHAGMFLSTGIIFVFCTDDEGCGPTAINTLMVSSYRFNKTKYQDEPRLPFVLVSLADEGDQEPNYTILF